VLKVVVEEAALAGYLIASGRLTGAESLVRTKVEHAVAEVLLDLAQRWMAHEESCNR